MSDNTQTPQTVTAVGITVNGTKLAFLPGTNPRGKGEEKNAPLFAPVYANGTDPALSEVVRHLTALGDNAAAKAIAHEILKPLYLAASKMARVVNDGVQQIDPGKFAQAAIDLLKNFTESQSEKAKYEAQLSEVEGKIAEITNKLIAKAGSAEGLKPTDPLVLESQQLLLARTTLSEQLKKLAAKKKGAQPAATPVAAAPAAAAVAAPAK